jgi:tRNA threonylcarbamoyl adenosine modification protein YeaZ
MSFYICLHNTYSSVELILSDSCSISHKIVISKERASADLIPEIDNLLKSQNIGIKEISCLIVNQGPAPFTTLRTMIATANGISFATKIPLIGVDGLISLLREYTGEKHVPTVALLNAFNKAVYYAYQLDCDTKPVVGYDSVVSFLETIAGQVDNSTVRFLGNGSSLYKNEIIEIFGNHALFPEPLPQTASAEFILEEGLKLWHQKKEGCVQIEPLYLKKPIA